MTIKHIRVDEQLHSILQHMKVDRKMRSLNLLVWSLVKEESTELNQNEEQNGEKS